jgi:hypothetical protein
MNLFKLSRIRNYLVFGSNNKPTTKMCRDNNDAKQQTEIDKSTKKFLTAVAPVTLPKSQKATLTQPTAISAWTQIPAVLVFL